MSLFTIGILNSTKHLIVHLKFLTMMTRIRVRLYRSTSATLNVVLDHHERNENQTKHDQQQQHHSEEEDEEDEEEDG